uniref:Uncharacterized protein n=1 Tax=Panagrolaimus davidi TaxID=227884 RepID=A0A914PYN5_9BILA
MSQKVFTLDGILFGEIPRNYNIEITSELNLQIKARAEFAISSAVDNAQKKILKQLGKEAKKIEKQRQKNYKMLTDLKQEMEDNDVVECGINSQLFQNKLERVQVATEIIVNQHLLLIQNSKSLLESYKEFNSTYKALGEIICEKQENGKQENAEINGNGIINNMKALAPIGVENAKKPRLN